MYGYDWVRWSQYSKPEYGPNSTAVMLDYGQMPISNVNKYLAEFENEAKELLDKTGADHVVYGVKLFSEDGKLEEVEFYMLEVEDKKFYENFASAENCIVYAVHAMK